MYVHLKRLKRAGHVVKAMNSGIPKQILKGSFKRRRPAGKPRNK
jgi:hypothetical protein